MNFLEQNLEQIIFESDRNDLKDCGLAISGKLLRQKRIGNYGIADIISVEKINNLGFPILKITVYELKRDIINNDSFLQALSYLKGNTGVLRT